MSTERDRDRSLERLLGRELPRLHDEVPGVSAECLEAETAAAWAERRVPLPDLPGIEAHVAGCARCQQLIAIMAAVAPDESSSAVQSQPARTPWWPARVPWVAAAAVAAMAIVIVGFTVQRARDTGVNPTFAGTRATQERPTAQEPVTIVGRADPVAPSEPPKAAAPPVEAQESRKVTPSAASQAAPDSSDANAATAAPSDRAIAPAAPTSTLAGAARQESARGADATLLDRFALQERVSLAEIRSPDPAIRWRLTDPGSVEHTVDGGATWERLVIDAQEPIAAGSSPAAPVCWLVGRAGTVLLSTNGTDFDRVAAPTTSDLTSIDATDGRHATVTAADGRAFKTSDGGQSWQPAIP